MIVTRGYGSQQLIITRGYGIVTAPYIPPVQPIGAPPTITQKKRRELVARFYEITGTLVVGEFQMIGITGSLDSIKFLRLPISAELTIPQNISVTINGHLMHFVQTKVSVEGQKDVYTLLELLED